MEESSSCLMRAKSHPEHWESYDDASNASAAPIRPSTPNRRHSTSHRSTRLHSDRIEAVTSVHIIVTRCWYASADWKTR
jgi:hypothetical protein